METNERMVDLARRLLALTKTGKLKWDSTASEDIFLASLPGNTVTIDFSGDRALLQIHNADGRLVDTLIPSWMDVPERDLLEELFADARRSAMKVDEVLDDLFANLDRLAS